MARALPGREWSQFRVLLEELERSRFPDERRVRRSVGAGSARLMGFTEELASLGVCEGDRKRWLMEVFARLRR